MRENILIRQTALRNFEQARRRAWREQLSAKLTSRDAHLLPFEQIRAQLKQKNPMYRGIQPVPLDQIAGSVGRYKEFTRHFLPLHDSFRERWISIEALAVSEGWPPLELYRIGDVYFVKDGNHRVAVAQQLEMDTVEAHVWAFPEEVCVGPDDQLDDVLIRFGERKFLDTTALDELRPEHQIRFTTPGRYTELLAQIDELNEKLNWIDNTELPFQEAVTAWYDLIYLPTVQIIHDTHLLDQFPGRTETDLFVWLSLSREQLGERYGEYESLEALARALGAEHREDGLGKLTRQVRRLLGQDILPQLVTLSESPSATDVSATEEE